MTCVEFKQGRAMMGAEQNDGQPRDDEQEMFSFGEAIGHIKAGGRAARAGWNGKDMWIAYGEGNKALPAPAFWNKHTRDFAKTQPGECAEVLPYIIFKTADNKILMGWLASQTDMLATDWKLLP